MKIRAVQRLRAGIDRMEQPPESLPAQGKHDGLYGPAQQAEKESPLTIAAGGDPFADQELLPSSQPLVFRSYVFRVLSGQGSPTSRVRFLRRGLRASDDPRGRVLGAVSE